MKMPLSKKWTRISLILVGLCGIATLNFNCSPSLFESAKYSNGNAMNSFSIFDNLDSPMVLLTAEQTYQSMLNVSGQADAPVSGAEYSQRVGMLSTSSSVTNINSPLLLGSTSLAGDICNNMTLAERAMPMGSRRYFNQLNFDVAPDLNGLMASAQAMAVGFWGRGMTAEEAGMINEYLSAMTAGQAANATLTRQTALGMCAAMLSSFDAIVY